MTDAEVAAQWRGAVLTTLESIDRSLDSLVGLARKAGAVTVSDGPVHAGDTELDLPAADEIVRLKPKDWTGSTDYKGSRMSLCPPEFLDQLALVYDYFAKKNDEAGAVDAQGRAKSFYDQRTARRARGWAARLRAAGGNETPVQPKEIGWSARTW